MTGFVIKDRFGNLIGSFETAVAAARWAIANFGEDGWQCVPLRAPETFSEGER